MFHECGGDATIIVNECKHLNIDLKWEKCYSVHKLKH